MAADRTVVSDDLLLFDDPPALASILAENEETIFPLPGEFMRVFSVTCVFTCCDIAQSSGWKSSAGQIIFQASASSQQWTRPSIVLEFKWKLTGAGGVKLKKTEAKIAPVRFSVRRTAFVNPFQIVRVLRLASCHIFVGKMSV